MTEEMVIIVDEEDNEIAVVPRSKMRKETLMHRGSAIFVENSKGGILIHKRTETKDVFPGFYDASFGGAVVEGETYEENAKRELEEEAGLKNIKLKFLFITKYMGRGNRSFIGVFSVKSDGPFKFQEEEVEKAFFVSKGELPELIKKEKFRLSGLKLLKGYLKHKNETIQEL